VIPTRYRCVLDETPGLGRASNVSGVLLERLAGAAQAALLIVTALIAAEQPARAYTDPGTGALIWQIVAASFIGVMFYLRKFMSRFRRKKPGAQEDRQG
jgi:hypothetical protein